jgi:hypothetical protein
MPLPCSHSSLQACFVVGYSGSVPAYLAANFNRSDARSSDRNLRRSFVPRLFNSSAGSCCGYCYRCFRRHSLSSSCRSFRGSFPGSFVGNDVGSSAGCCQGCFLRCRFQPAPRFAPAPISSVPLPGACGDSPVESPTPDATGSPALTPNSETKRQASFGENVSGTGDSPSGLRAGRRRN